MAICGHYEPKSKSKQLRTARNDSRGQYCSKEATAEKHARDGSPSGSWVFRCEEHASDLAKFPVFVG